MSKRERSAASAEAQLVAQLGRRDSARMARYADALAFFRGEQWVGRARPGERRLTFNYAQVFVEKVTSYLLEGRQTLVHPLDDSPTARAQADRALAALAEIAETNDLESLDFDTELDAAVLGDGAYKVGWDTTRRQVTISAPDVQGLYVWTAADDSRQIRRVATRTVLPADEASELTGHPLTGDAPTTVSEVWTETTFALYVGGQPARRTANPYGFIPFVIFPNQRQPKSLWGVSDIEAIRAPLLEINRAFTQLSRMLETATYPITVLENVEKTRDIAVTPGAVWEMPPDSRAYLLDLLGGGSVKLHLDYIDCVYRALHDLAETPRTAFGDNSRALAGVALEIELQPLAQKVARKRLVRATAYAARACMALRLRELFLGEDYQATRPTLVWGPITPRDGSRQLADERLAVTSGLRSRRTAMARLGAEHPDREFARWLEEEREAMRTKDN